MKITEEVLWRFIDKDLTPEESEVVSQAIADDEVVSNLYLELLEQHDQFKGFFQQRQREQGSTSFTTLLGKLGAYSN